MCISVCPCVGDAGQRSTLFRHSSLAALSFETGSLSEPQANIRLITKLQETSLQLCRAGITGVYYHAWLLVKVGGQGQWGL